MNFLKSHPFAVEAFFEKSLVLTFAVPKNQLQTYIPECLQLETFDDKWAFLAVAMVKTKNLRPKGLPKFLGNNFYLIGYRIFVKYYNNQGKRLRGLYIIKTETDKWKMKFLGDIFTRYGFSKTDIVEEKNQNTEVIKSKKSKFEVSFNLTDNPAPIPNTSPFTDWSDARKFSGPLPHTFTYDQTNKTVLIIRGIRKNWKPKPIEVLDYNFDFLNQLNLENVKLASAFEIRNIPYYWEKGIIEKWK